MTEGQSQSEKEKVTFKQAFRAAFRNEGVRFGYKVEALGLLVVGLVHSIKENPYLTFSLLIGPATLGIGLIHLHYKGRPLLSKRG